MYEECCGLYFCVYVSEFVFDGLKVFDGLVELFVFVGVCYGVVEGGVGDVDRVCCDGDVVVVECF